MGGRFWKQGGLEAADAWVEAAELYDQDDSEFAASNWEAAGMAFRSAGAFVQAREAYVRALDSFKEPNKPAYRNARIGMAHAFLYDKDHDEAFTAAWWGLLPIGAASNRPPPIGFRESESSEYCDSLQCFMF